jgi:hypothetical protein
MGGNTTLNYFVLSSSKNKKTYSDTDDFWKERVIDWQHCIGICADGACAGKKQWIRNFQ